MTMTAYLPNQLTHLIRHVYSVKRKGENSGQKVVDNIALLSRSTPRRQTYWYQLLAVATSNHIRPVAYKRDSPHAGAKRETSTMTLIYMSYML